MSKRVLLINPPSANASFVPPPGLSYLSASLKDYGCEVFGIDAAAPFRRLTLEDVLQKVKEVSPDIVGISLNLYFIKGGYALAKEIKKLGIPLLAGGPHVRVCQKEAMENGFDIAVSGEGESAIREIIDYFNGKADIRQIKGAAFRDSSGRVVINPQRAGFTDLDRIPFLDREIFPIEHYIEKGSTMDTFAFPFFSGRGCPFRCIFCTVSNKSIRKRSVDNVFAEIEMLKQKYGLKRISFLDELFTLDKVWLDQFIQRLEKTGRQIKWNCESRVDTITEEYLLKMKKAGCVSVWFGVESYDPETLKRINKGVSVEDISKTLEALTRVNLDSVKLNFMWGFPWETKNHIINSANLIRKYIKKIRVLNSIVVPLPYPGTELYAANHEKFGFTEWWLRENSFSDTFEKYTPYFKQNTLIFDIQWMELNIFKHPARFSAFIKKMVIKYRKFVYASTYGFWRTEIIYVLSVVSLKLYIINPKLEASVFKLLRRILLRK